MKKIEKKDNIQPQLLSDQEALAIARAVQSLNTYIALNSDPETSAQFEVPSSQGTARKASPSEDNKV